MNPQQCRGLKGAVMFLIWTGRVISIVCQDVLERPGL